MRSVLDTVIASSPARRRSNGESGTGSGEERSQGTEPFWYVRSFYDLDNHHREVMWMDPKAVL